MIHCVDLNREQLKDDNDNNKTVDFSKKKMFRCLYVYKKICGVT